MTSTTQTSVEDTEVSSVRERLTMWVSYAASAWAFVFTIPHIYWSIGGTAGLAGHSMTGPLLAINLVAIPLCLLAAIVALATVQSWGEMVPRWLLLSLVWGAGAVLSVRGGVGLVQRALSIDQIGQQPVLALLADPWFLLGGVLFSLTAWSYTHR